MEITIIISLQIGFVEKEECLPVENTPTGGSYAAT